MAKISGKPLDKTFVSWVSITFSGTRVPFTISSSNEKIQSWYRQKQGFSFFFPILWCWNFANSQHCGGYIPHYKNSQKFPNILSKKWRSNFVGEKTLVGRDKVKSKSKENLHSSCNQLVGFQLSLVPVQAKHLPIRHRKGLLLPEKKFLQSTPLVSHLDAKHVVKATGKISMKNLQQEKLVDNTVEVNCFNSSSKRKNNHNKNNDHPWQSCNEIKTWGVEINLKCFFHVSASECNDPCNFEDESSP